PLARLPLHTQKAVHGSNRAVITPFIEQRGEDRRRRRISKAFAVEHAEQILLLGDGEGQRWSRSYRYPLGQQNLAALGTITVHVARIERESPTGRLHANLGRKVGDGEHYSSSLVSSAVGSPRATHSFFWASMINSARSSLRRRRSMSRFRWLI